VTLCVMVCPAVLGSSRWRCNCKVLFLAACSGHWITGAGLLVSRGGHIDLDG
jgi:hypothetical protein